MTELLYNCADTLPQPSTPTCATDYGERVVTIVLAKTPISTSQNVPSASDISAAFDAGTATIIKGISNGHKVFLGETEIEVIHKEWFDKQYRVEGNIKLVSESIARATEQLSRYPELIMYYVTEKEYCFGPYESNPNFTLIQTEGKGMPPFIRFNFDFIDTGIDYANYDASYDRIPYDLDGEAIITEDGFDFITEDGSETIIIES